MYIFVLTSSINILIEWCVTYCDKKINSKSLMQHNHENLFETWKWTKRRWWKWNDFQLVERILAVQKWTILVPRCRIFTQENSSMNSTLCEYRSIINFEDNECLGAVLMVNIKKVPLIFYFDLQSSMVGEVSFILRFKSPWTLSYKCSSSVILASFIK